jgi:uncharacterized protein YbbC (DUF1343 family)
MDLIKTGAEILVAERPELLRGKNIGIITNHTAIVRKSRPCHDHLLDVLCEQNDLSIMALFSPEHGIRGDIPPGQHVEHTIDLKTGIPIYSLYGEWKKPTPDMLNEIDLLIYDIQDVGVRFYTFISTLFYTMEAAAELGIPYLVLDRPNMLSNAVIDGPVLDNELTSFVGFKPIPVVYGLTPGELARMVNGEGWLRDSLQVMLDTIPVANYSRCLWYDETGMPWINPSPNLRSMEAVVVYPGIALLEGTNISEGRGTELPFLNIGAPFIAGAVLEKALMDMNIEGVRFEATTFIPMPSGQPKGGPKHSNKPCAGVQITVTERSVLKPVELGIHIICTLRDLYPNTLRFREIWFDRLIGSSVVRESIQKGMSSRDIIRDWQPQLTEYTKRSRRYYLYHDHEMILTTPAD